MRRSSRYNTAAIRCGGHVDSLCTAWYSRLQDAWVGFLLGVSTNGAGCIRYTLRTYIYIYKYVYMHTTAYNTIIIIKGPADIWTDPKEWTTIPTRRGAAVGWVGLQRCVYIFFFQKNTQVRLFFYVRPRTPCGDESSVSFSLVRLLRGRVYTNVCVCVFFFALFRPLPHERRIPI